MTAQVLEFPPSAVFRSAAERTYLEQCLEASRHRASDAQDAWETAARMCAATWEVVSRGAGKDAESRT